MQKHAKTRKTNPFFLNHKTLYLPLVFAASDIAQRQLAAALRKLWWIPRQENNSAAVPKLDTLSP
jgi:hypothetical protein